MVLEELEDLHSELSLIERNLNDVEIVAVNDLGKIESNLHLFKYDSVHGTFNDQTLLKHLINKNWKK